MATDKLTILMIDDDPEDITLVRGMLERIPVWSVELISCLDAKIAGQQAHQRKPDLILLDFNFGVASGLEVLPALRAAGFNGPVILLSGCGRQELASMVNAGLTDFLSKNDLSSLTLYHAITLAMEKIQLPQKRERGAVTENVADRPTRMPSATSSTPPRVRY
jgi:CheY-like chemotaxis protein